MPKLDEHATDEAIGMLEAALEQEGSNAWRAAADALTVIVDLSEDPGRGDALEEVYVIGALEDPPGMGPIRVRRWLSLDHELLLGFPGPTTAFLALWFGPAMRPGPRRRVIEARLDSWRTR